MNKNLLFLYIDQIFLFNFSINPDFILSNFLIGWANNASKNKAFQLLRNKKNYKFINYA